MNGENLLEGLEHHIQKLAMRKYELGTVIAERVLEVTGGDSDEAVVRIGAPYEYSDEDGISWVCPYQIIGLGDETVRAAEGEDAVQAIQLVMWHIGATIKARADARNMRISWLTQNDPGFLNDQVKDAMHGLGMEPDEE